MASSAGATSVAADDLARRQVLELLLDRGSVPGLERRRSFAPEVRPPRVATAWGNIHSRPVFAFCADSHLLNGSDADALCGAFERAMATGTPIVGLRRSNEEGGPEVVADLAIQGRILDASARASGVVPQINIVAGRWLGGSSFGAALGDVVIAVEDAAEMYVNNTRAVEEVTAQLVTGQELGGATSLSTRSGLAQLVVPDLHAALEYARYTLSFLGANSLSSPPFYPPTDDPDRACSAIEAIVPSSPNAAYDVTEVLADIVDDGEVFQLHEGWAKNMVTAFARLDGRAVGIVASQPAVLAGTLDIDSSIKAARFVRLCDQFNVPLLTMLDVPGFRPGVDEEYRGIIRHGAKLVYAFAEATVPRITLITRKAYGGAYIVMNSRHIRADLSFAWPSAEIAVMGAEGAAKVIHKREVAAAPDPLAREKELVAEYREAFANPYLAAERGYVDAVIAPRDTRRALIQGFNMLSSKRETLPSRKHDNIPL